MELLNNTKTDIKTTMSSLKEFLKSDIQADELEYINKLLCGIAESAVMDTKNSINIILFKTNLRIGNLKKSV